MSLAQIYLSLVGGGCLILGVRLLYQRMAFFFSAARATGSFVRWEPRGLRTIHQYPVVRFEAHDGVAYEFVGMPGSTRPRKKDRYTVLYAREHPANAQIHNWVYWFAPMAFLILAAALAVAFLKN